MSQGEDMSVAVVDDDSILFRRTTTTKGKRRRTKGSSEFFGILKEKTGAVEHWPTPEEIKSIWK